MNRVWIGTSGWTYNDWRGPFYPRTIAKKDWLSWYATQFTTTEVNGSFYRTPSLDTVHRWRDQTPDGFQLAWKASRFITHWRRLGADSERSIALMTERLKILGRKCGPVLFQLPSRFEADADKLAAFLAMLPSRHRYVFEFRHASWYERRILDLLRAHDVALCLSDHHQAPVPWTVTASHIYIRGHGPGGDYKANYPDTALQSWAERIRRWRRQRHDVFVYFDNDQKSAAPHDARRLIAILDARATRVPRPQREAKSTPRRSRTGKAADSPTARASSRP